MTEFHSPFGELPYIPDDLTIPQFILDHSHPTRPINRLNAPWFIEESTGRKVGFEEVCQAEFTRRMCCSDWSFFPRSVFVHLVLQMP